MIAMSKDGDDAIWAWGTEPESLAVIAPKKPETQQGAKQLMALMAHLQFNEWHWFDPR